MDMDVPIIEMQVVIEDRKASAVPGNQQESRRRLCKDCPAAFLLNGKLYTARGVEVDVEDQRAGYQIIDCTRWFQAQMRWFSTWLLIPSFQGCSENSASKQLYWLMYDEDLLSILLVLKVEVKDPMLLVSLCVEDKSIHANQTN